MHMLQGPAATVHRLLRWAILFSIVMGDLTVILRGKSIVPVDVMMLVRAPTIPAIDQGQEQSTRLFWLRRQ